FFVFQAEDGIRRDLVTGVQTCALPISIFILLFGISGLIAFIVGFKDQKLHYKIGIVVGIITFAISILAYINSFPLIIYSYDTTQSWNAFLAHNIFSIILESLIDALPNFLIVITGETLYRK